MATKYRDTPEQIDHMPGGIPYIIANEAAERFSFYGMKAILFIFMTRYLVDASGMKDVFSDKEANAVVHLFTAAVYFFPIIGAILSDAVLGKYRTILYVSLLYCAGHAALAINETWIGLAVGLTLISLGAGGIKPCVSAHVGDQFGTKNKHLLEKVFGWFYFSINLGAFSSTLLTPLLLYYYGPWLAFGLPGVLMALATFAFWLGRNKFVHIPPGGMGSLREALSGDGIRAIVNLVPIYLCVAVFWSIFDQTATSWIGQSTQMNRNFLGIQWLPSQVQAINPLLIMLFIPLFTYLVYPAMNKVWKLTPLRKIGIGLCLAIIACSIPALIEGWITGGRVMSNTSEANQNVAAAEQLLDGSPEGIGWLSESKVTYDASLKEQFPQSIVVRLRERRPWTVSQVRLLQATDAAKYFSTLKLKVPAEEPAAGEEEKSAHVKTKWVQVTPEQADEMALKSRTKKAIIFAGNAPKPEEWEEIGTIEFAPDATVASVDFKPIKTEYIKIQVESNFGGDYVGLGEIEVMADGAAPAADADPAATDVWPNVAAYGRQPSIGWQLVAFILLTAAEIMISITGLEFSYSQSPKKVKSFIMSLWLLSVAVGNLFAAGVNHLIDNEDGTTVLDGPAYFWFFSGVMAFATVAYIVIAQFYKGKTYIQGEDDDNGGDDGGTDDGAERTDAE